MHFFSQGPDSKYFVLFAPVINNTCMLGVAVLQSNSIYKNRQLPGLAQGPQQLADPSSKSLHQTCHDCVETRQCQTRAGDPPNHISCDSFPRLPCSSLLPAGQMNPASYASGLLHLLPIHPRAAILPDFSMVHSLASSHLCSRSTFL